MMSAAGLLASALLAAPAHGACAPARKGPSVAGLPAGWRAAVDELVRSTSEPGHPWSCAGGTVDLELAPKGAVLRVAREGQPPVARQVSSPDEVVPLGEALLATPLSPQEPATDEPPTPARPEPAAPDASPSPARPDAATPDAAPSELPSPRAGGASQSPELSPGPGGKPLPRLLVGGGLEGRYAGGTDVGWLGPEVGAAVPVGSWLPGISMRHQSSVLGGRPRIEELSVALVVQRRVELSPVELRVGLLVRGAAVQRDLPHRRGDQSRIDARAGATGSVVIPAFRWASVVISADAEVVGASRQGSEPEATEAEPSPRPFPSFTVGGSAGLEVAL